jgi:hypothetical protein
MEPDLIVVGRPLPRIAAAAPLDGRRVRLAWRGGTSRVVDLAPVLASHRAFIALRSDDALFATLRVNEDGNALEWADGSELSAEWIERLPPCEMTNAEFRAAMDALEMSLDGMAAALQVSRRLVAAYRKDKPVPRHIAHATRYLDASKNPCVPGAMMIH